MNERAAESLPTPHHGDDSPRKRLDALLGLAEGLSRALDIHSVVEASLNAAILLPDVRGVCFWRLGDHGHFHLAGQRGMPPMVTVPDLCACQRAFLGGELTSACNVVECERQLPPPGAQAHAFRHVSIPLEIDGRRLGIVNMIGPEPATRAEFWLPTADTIGRLVSLAWKRVELEEALRRHAAERKDHAQALMAGALDAVLLVDEAGVIREANPRAEQYLGVDRGTIVGRPYAAFLPPEEFHRAAQLHAQAFTQGVLEPTEMLVLRPDGGRVELEIRGSIVSLPGGAQLLLVAHDQAEQNAVRRALRESQETLASLVQAAPVAIVSLDIEGHVRTWNPAAERLFGWTGAEAIGRIPPYVAPTQEAEFHALIRLILETGTVSGLVVTRRRKDGTRVDLQVSGTRLCDPERRPVGVMSVLVDVTETRRLQEQVQQAQKMEAVGRLAGGVAHDFNNLLTVICGYAQMLQGRIRAGDPTAPMLAEIAKAAERATGLTRQLLAFSRKQLLQPRVVDLNALVHDLAKMLTRLIGEDVRLETVPGPDLGRVRVDPGQIEQVIMNLAINARDAMPNGGTLTICTGNTDLGDEFVRDHPGSRPGRYVTVSVADTGVGMTREVLEHLFEPFFTTKDLGRGTGLGLATVYGIVQQSDGYVEVDSRPGTGSTFRVHLPRIDQPIDPIEPATTHRDPLPRGTETILVVEDEEDVRCLACHALENSGYRVRGVRDGPEALAELAREAVDLLISDLVMPRMSGQELARRGTLLLPRMRVLFMTGYPEHPGAPGEPVPAGADLILKPFTPAQLALRVREALDRGR